MSVPIRNPVPASSWWEQLQRERPDIAAQYAGLHIDTPHDYRSYDEELKGTAPSGLRDSGVRGSWTVVERGEPQMVQGDQVFMSDRAPTLADAPVTPQAVYWFDATTGQLWGYQP